MDIKKYFEYTKIFLFILIILEINIFYSLIKGIDIFNEKKPKKSKDKTKVFKNLPFHEKLKV